MNEYCYKCFNTTSVAIVGGVLVLTIPEIELKNCTELQIRIAQDIPAGITADMLVAIKSGDNLAYTILNPCCPNYVYADQIRKCAFYFVRFGTDTECFVLKGGWRLCRTAHIFVTPVIPTEEVAIAKTTKTITKKAEVKKDE